LWYEKFHRKMGIEAETKLYSLSGGGKGQNTSSSISPE
jgi:hypothetical protein